MGSKWVKLQFGFLFCLTRGIALSCSRNPFLIKSSFRPHIFLQVIILIPSADNMVPKRITSKIVTQVIEEISILVLMLHIMYVHAFHILSYNDIFYYFTITSVIYGVELAKKLIRSINRT